MTHPDKTLEAMSAEELREVVAEVLRDMEIGKLIATAVVDVLESRKEEARQGADYWNGWYLGPTRRLS